VPEQQTSCHKGLITLANGASGRGRSDLGDFYNQLLPAMWAGARLRCPVCGKGRMYASLTRLNEQCPACGIRFEPEQGTFSGALMLAMGITGLLVALGALSVELLFHPPAEVQLWLWILFACLFLPLTYPSFKGAWLGFMYTLKRMP